MYNLIVANWQYVNDVDKVAPVRRRKIELAPSNYVR